MTERDLAVRIGAREGGKSPTDVTEAGHRRIRLALHHHHLPKLETEGFIDCRPEGVVATERLSSGNSVSTRPQPREPNHPSWDALAPLVGRPRRQRVVSILSEQAVPVTLQELAEKLATRERDAGTKDGNDDYDPLVRLHHVDLPKLSDAGLIDYDSDRTTITATAPPTAVAGLLAAEDLDETDGRTRP
jgi:DNA-binding transcriptional ArsR family regulator